MREEYTLVWDGEPSMSGRPHRHSIGTFRTRGEARNAAKHVPNMKTKPGLRIEKRFVSEWLVVVNLVP